MMAKTLDEAQRIDELVAASRVISTPISGATGSSETATMPVRMKIANKGPVLFARTGVGESACLSIRVAECDATYLPR